jgi:DNA repair photolyase
MQHQPAGQSLTGIARLAAESDEILEKRRVRYFGMRSRSILNRCSNPKLPFYWTINPYRGCEFGCKYCYARYTHEYMGMEDGTDFERLIYNKESAAAILAGELTGRKLKSRPIAIGTATDPYQPAERHFETTRQILSVLASNRGLRVSITTKSCLITRDIELLRELQARNQLHVHMTLTTMRPELARLLEPMAPTPDRRMAAVKSLSDAGIRIGVNLMPVIPMITDTPADLAEVVEQAKQAGASFLAARVLFLMPAAKKVFFPFLENEFPELVSRYQRLYKQSAYLRGAYAKNVEDLIERLRRLHELPSVSAQQSLRDQVDAWQQASFGFGKLS